MFLEHVYYTSNNEKGTNVMAMTDWGQEVEEGFVLIKNNADVVSVDVDMGNICELQMVLNEMHPNDDFVVKSFVNGIMVES